MATAREKARSRLRGAILGLTTPFSPNGEAIDEVGFRQNIESYVTSGIRTLVIGGTYGEVTSLTMEERKYLIRTAVEQTDGRATVIADTHHVGSLAEVISLTRYAENVGADFAYVLTPYYWRPTDQALLEFYRRVAGSVSIGIMLYTNPWRTHVRLSPNVVSELVKFENIVAIKAADPDIADVSELLALVGDELVVGCGWEVHAIQGRVLGGQCYFGIVGNFDPALERKYEEAIMNQNWANAREIHSSLLDLRRTFKEVDAPVVFKAAQDMVGLRGGPVRLPLWPAAEVQKRRLAELLRRLGTRVTVGTP